MKLIEREVSSALDGTASFDYLPDGLRALLSIPFDERFVSISPQTKGQPVKLAECV